MKSRLYSLDEAKKIVESNANLIIGGHELLLNQLPKGNWIGATINRFLDIDGGLVSNDKVFITDLSGVVINCKIKIYNESTLSQLISDSYDNGFSFILMPAFSKVHAEFGANAFMMDGLFNNPVVGWVAGIDNNDKGKFEPKVFDGQQAISFSDVAIVMHCQLPDKNNARIEIINPFNQGDGDRFEFLDSSFEIKDCLINGELKNLSEYILNHKIDERLPLVADLGGAKINVHDLFINIQDRTVTLAATVIPGIIYRYAKPIDDYIGFFQSKVPADSSNIVATINCHANYEYLQLKGHKLGDLTGPFAFGEIAYLLLNQTTVNLYIDEVNPS